MQAVLDMFDGDTPAPPVLAPEPPRPWVALRVATFATLLDHAEKLISGFNEYWEKLQLTSDELGHLVLVVAAPDFRARLTVPWEEAFAFADRPFGPVVLPIKTISKLAHMSVEGDLWRLTDWDNALVIEGPGYTYHLQRDEEQSFSGEIQMGGAEEFVLSFDQLRSIVKQSQWTRGYRAGGATVLDGVRLDTSKQRTIIASQSTIVLMEHLEFPEALPAFTLEENIARNLFYLVDQEKVDQEAEVLLRFDDPRVGFSWTHPDGRSFDVRGLTKSKFPSVDKWFEDIELVRLKVDTATINATMRRIKSAVTKDEQYQVILTVSFDSLRIDLPEDETRKHTGHETVACEVTWSEGAAPPVKTSFDGRALHALISKLDLEKPIEFAFTQGGDGRAKNFPPLLVIEQEDQRICLASMKFE